MSRWRHQGVILVCIIRFVGYLLITLLRGDEGLPGRSIDPNTDYVPTERAKVRRAMEMMLQKTAMKIVTTAMRDLDHIPPITTSESNPFPYQIVINPRDDTWRRGIF